MKTTAYIIPIFMMLFNFTCKKEEPITSTKTIVVRDCTGTYLRENGKDYHVCNIDKVAPFADGATVEASFNKISECKNANNTVVCEMYHENEGWIEVVSIK